MIRPNVRRLLLRLLIRLSVIFIAAGGLLLLPEADGESVLHYKNAGVVLCALIFGGKALYDTLFYDRYC